MNNIVHIKIKLYTLIVVYYTVIVKKQKKKQIADTKIGKMKKNLLYMESASNYPLQVVLNKCKILFVTNFRRVLPFLLALQKVKH